MKFFFDTTADADQAQQNLAYQAHFQNVTWACSICASENTTETTKLTPSGVNHQVWCANCGRTTNGMPPKRFRASGGAEPTGIDSVKDGDEVAGWGIVKSVRPADNHRYHVMTESGFAFHVPADEVVMVMAAAIATATRRGRR